MHTSPDPHTSSDPRTLPDSQLSPDPQILPEQSTSCNAAPAPIHATALAQDALSSTPLPSGCALSIPLPPSTSTHTSEAMMYAYLTHQFPKQSQWREVILSHRGYPIHNVAVGAAYKQYLQHRIILCVCSTLGLDHTKPTRSSLLLEINGLSVDLTVEQIIHWSGRAPNTYRNKKTLMEKLHSTLQVIPIGAPDSSLHTRYRDLLVFRYTPDLLQADHITPSLSWTFDELSRSLQ